MAAVAHDLVNKFFWSVPKQFQQGHPAFNNHHGRWRWGEITSISNEQHFYPGGLLISGPSPALPRYHHLSRWTPGAKFSNIARCAINHVERRSRYGQGTESRRLLSAWENKQRFITLLDYLLGHKRVKVARHLPSMEWFCTLAYFCLGLVRFGFVSFSSDVS